MGYDENNKQKCLMSTKGLLKQINVFFSDKQTKAVWHRKEGIAIV